MELEMDVEDLLNKRKLESDRIEFKTGWNPDDIYHSVCAFANDYNNDGGGYIVVGVEEENGVAKRPVKGLPEYMLDSIQKDMLGYNNLISPPYFPQGIPAEVDGKWIFVIVVRTGQQRPYKSPEHVTSKKEKKYNYYIRYQTSSVKANREQERELINMSDQTPFDCRANHKATFEDISPVLLEDHLRKTGSKLAKQVRERGVEKILNDMQLLVGPPELRYIQNVAIMMFCEHPEKFFGYTYVQMTSFPKGSIENPSISEDFPNITGSVPQMIQATMERFRNLIIREKVIKVPNQMEALRIFNYPYQAIEEAVVNAFYHRDYMSFEPVTIEIEPDCINIMNFPGIDRSISEKTISEGKRFVSRYYRNRRLGEFLKELDLSEGHSSGIPTIQEELEKNGSPRAEFFTDEDRRAMRIRIPIHPAFLEADDEVLLPDSYEKATKKSSKKKIEQYLYNQNAEEKEVELPQNMDGVALRWEEETEKPLVIFLFLGIFAAVVILWSGKKEQQDAKKRWEEELVKDYPEMVSRLGLLLEAGMSLRQAWKKLTDTYESKRKKQRLPKRAGYEEMLLTRRELEDGMGESLAYERFGERCGLASYRRFASILTQNLKKGTVGIGRILAKESEDAFSQRKTMAQRLGEEAGTKLLFPMLMMMVVIMVILVVPACMTMHI